MEKDIDLSKKDDVFQSCIKVKENLLKLIEPY